MSKPLRISDRLAEQSSELLRWKKERLKPFADAYRVSKAPADQKAAATYELIQRELRRRYEQDLYAFVRDSWTSFDSSEFQDGWAMKALCDHLQAVTRGQIKRLLINFPPRCAKSNIASIAWPAWVWAQSERTYMSGPNVRFLCGSYNHTLSLQHSNSGRRLLTSPFYQEYWGDRYSLMADQNAKSQYDTDKGGRRIATSVGGSLIGIGGDVCLVDDPHNTESVESEADREKVLRWWKELSSTRLNDPKQSSIVVVMQRLHESDVSGTILAGTSQEWTHLMLPMRYSPDRHCVTTLSVDPPIQWEDPRRETGETLLWPDRYGEKEVKGLEIDLGPYMASGRLQQLPTPAGGGILKREWWQLWNEPTFPACAYKWASADTAYTEKDDNDPTGFTAWGLFYIAGQPNIILLDAWRKRLELHIPARWVADGSPESREKLVTNWKRSAWSQHRRLQSEGKSIPEPTIDPLLEPWATFIATGHNAAERWPNETYELWMYRTQEKWGLCEWLAHSCRRFEINELIIEGKASGLSVAQELQRLHGNEGWGIKVVTPEGDKVARAYAVQSTFSAGLVHAPDREWAEMVLEETSVFPKGRFKDLTDSTTQAIKHIRDIGLLLRPEERQFMEQEIARYRAPSKVLYPV